MVIITPGAFAVTGSVSDALVNQIAIGQSAQVIAAGSQEAVTGKVTSIAEEATLTSGTATFPVTITLDQSQPALRAGMSATVNVVEEEDIPLSYLPGNSLRVRVRVVGDIAGA